MKESNARLVVTRRSPSRRTRLRAASAPAGELRAGAGYVRPRRRVRVDRRRRHALSRLRRRASPCCALGHAHPRDYAKRYRSKPRRSCRRATFTITSRPGRSRTSSRGAPGLERVFFCNSGTEANEAAIKLARKLAFRRGEKQRRDDSGVLGLVPRADASARSPRPTNPKYHEGFGPLPGGFASYAFNDVAALESAIDETVAAFIVEPMQGESGDPSGRPSFLAAARRLRANAARCSSSTRFSAGWDGSERCSRSKPSASVRTS